MDEEQKVEIAQDEDRFFKPEDESPPAKEPEPQAKEPAKEPEELVKLRSQIENLNKALSEERRRRQELDRLIEWQTFQAKFNQPVQQAASQQREEDPDVAALKPLVQPILQEAMGPIEAENRRIRAELCEEKARQRWKNYDEVVSEFLPQMQRDPFLMEMFLKSPDPAEFVYKHGMMAQMDRILERARTEGRQEVVKRFESAKEASPSLSKVAESRRTDDIGITLEEAKKLSPTAWAELPEKTRRRLLAME